MGGRAKVGGVTEHFCQRHFGTDFFAADTVVIHTQDNTATTVQVTHHVAHIVFRRFHFNGHNRLKQNGVGFFHAFFESHGSSQLKRDLRRVHVMVGTENQTDAYVHNRIAGHDAVRQGVANTFVARRNEFARNHAAFDFVDKLVACATGFHRFHFDHNVTVLAFTAGLFDVFGFGFDFFANGFAVGHLRSAHVGFHAEFAFHTVDDDFQVQFAHTGNNGLAGFFVGTHAERRVFFGQTVQGDTHFLLVGLGFRLNRNVDYRLGEFHSFQNDRRVLGTQGFTGGNVFQADCSGDVAGAHFFNLGTVCGSHLHQTADTLAGTFNRVQHAVA